MLKIFSTPTGLVRIVAGITAIALVLAMAAWPYGYYQVLRVVVFFAGLYCGVTLRRSPNPEDQRTALMLFAAALIFNPFVPVFLPRGVWAVLDLVGAGLFGFVAYRRPARLPGNP